MQERKRNLSVLVSKVIGFFKELSKIKLAGLIVLFTSDGHLDNGQVAEYPRLNRGVILKVLKHR
jgi:hypothetical protein